MRRHAGFTLVELLVRDCHHRHSDRAVAAGDSECARGGDGARSALINLKQIGLAHLQYESVNRKFANGAGSLTQPLPNTPWTVSILPFLQEQALSNALNKIAGSNRPIIQYDVGPSIFSTPVVSYYCPSRRPAVAYPTAPFSVTGISTSTATRTDYALNGGAKRDPDIDYDPPIELPGIWAGDGLGTFVRRRDIKDGLGKTYLVAEKVVVIDDYTTGLGRGDTGNMFQCSGANCMRVAHNIPVPDPNNSVKDFDEAGIHFLNIDYYFGSAHPGIWNAIFCDGSVHSMSYGINFATHRALASRAGGDVPDPKQY